VNENVLPRGNSAKYLSKVPSVNAEPLSTSARAWSSAIEKASILHALAVGVLSESDVLVSHRSRSDSELVAASVEVEPPTACEGSVGKADIWRPEVAVAPNIAAPSASVDWRRISAALWNMRLILSPFGAAASGLGFSFPLKAAE
jgi:hypothetical protein